MARLREAAAQLTRSCGRCGSAGGAADAGRCNATVSPMRGLFGRHGRGAAAYPNRSGCVAKVNTQSLSGAAWCELRERLLSPKPELHKDESSIARVQNCKTYGVCINQEERWPKSLTRKKGGALRKGKEEMEI